MNAVSSSAWRGSLPPASVDGRPTAKVVVKPGKAKPFFGRHPWVLEKAVDKIEGKPQDGDVVDLVAENGHFIARGLLNRNSRIVVRLYSWRPEKPLDEAFWKERLTRALELRKRLGCDAPGGGARLVFSEGDHASGLIVDRYADYLVLQISSLGIARQVGPLVEWLAAETGAKGVYLRLEKGMAQLEGLSLEEGLIAGTAPDGPVWIEENEIHYSIDLGTSQKTGFYLDQRENRRAAARWLAGARVLDAFCYTGSFGLNALKWGGAKEVLGVDSSEKAVEAARRHAERNGFSAQATYHVADVFDDLQARAEAKEKFDAVLLDPPKMARNRAQVDDALRAYYRLNRLAIDLLPPGGILVTSSCSGQVTREDLVSMLVGVAQKSGRDLQILEVRGAAPDHPVSASCSESEYLKCLICRVS